jgi:hypothetical protein
MRSQAKINRVQNKLETVAKAFTSDTFKKTTKSAENIVMNYWLRP